MCSGTWKHEYWVTSSCDSSMKIMDILFYFLGYENSKGLAIIQDFTAHWAIKNKQMANVLSFYLESESSQLEWRMFPYDLDIELK